MLTTLTSRFITNAKQIATQRNVHLYAALCNSNTETTTTAAAETPLANVEAELKQLKEKQKKCDEDLADFKDRYMRALADAENTRRIMRKQVDEAKVFGIQNFCKDLLEVADILNLAIVNTDAEKVKTAQNSDEQFKLMKTQFQSMFDGLNLTETKLIKIFEKHGLTRIAPVEGEKFDPNHHDALFRAQIPNKEPGTICTVNQTGYKLQERVIRAAKVGVVQ